MRCSPICYICLYFCFEYVSHASIDLFLLVVGRLREFLWQKLFVSPMRLK